MSNKERVVDIEIDVLSPCLICVSTGEIVDTFYTKASISELEALKRQDWNFNWQDKDLKDSDIYKITVEGSNEIQGLIALRGIPQDKAVYIVIVESAPHNRGKSRQYNGVGGHLFAVAAQCSIELGYDGFMYMEVKNEELANHYEAILGAVSLGSVTGLTRRMYIDEEAAHVLLSEYTLQEV